MGKIEQINNAMEIVDRRIALQKRYSAANEESEKAYSAYTALETKLMTEFDKDVYTLAKCQEELLERGNELIDIRTIYQVENLLGILSVAEIKKFTVSISDDMLMQALNALDIVGYKPIGMTKVYAMYPNRGEDYRDLITAVIMEMK